MRNQAKKVWAQRVWLKSYFAQFMGGSLRRTPLSNNHVPIDFIISAANHFEPDIANLGLRGAMNAVKEWCRDLEGIPVFDSDGNPFKYTYYYPAELYHPKLLDILGMHCRKGFGEVEVHIHHGIDAPDESEMLKVRLQGFLEKLCSHGFLSYDIQDTERKPRYCFVHGNWALANSAGGLFCGVDDEMQILRETGCYMDCTLPSAPDCTQVKKINSIYQCGYPLCEKMPHRDGEDLKVGDKKVVFPFLLQGPLLIDWGTKRGGFYFPRIENGAINDFQPPSIRRFRLWASTNIRVQGRPNWIFLKLHTHGLQFDHVNSARGPVLEEFLAELSRAFNDGIHYRLHFTTSRETANIILAAIDGKNGNPSQYRNYRFRPLQS